ncbi:hypothetical protein OX459_15785 [Janthinobacterium sp. SUN026]|uniref:hypothetical protein n=1 Tax=Janthinobacterium sp. SUN026 TaxID=3002438 RepID=UPI0025B1D45D|nr:hypothetical protein [Janthinobacterium sp. SUN026]MDN2672864.1 hypothetical protein [Janthinobacterium sp. SUN026]
MNKKIKRSVVVASLVVAGMTSAVAAVAAPTDYTALTGAVDMSSVITAILAIAATLAGLFVAMRGAKTVLGMIRGR